MKRSKRSQRVRDTSMQIRLTKDEQTRIRRAAEKLGSTVSSWSRSTLLREADKENAGP